MNYKKQCGYILKHVVLGNRKCRDVESSRHTFIIAKGISQFICGDFHTSYIEAHIKIRDCTCIGMPQRHSHWMFTGTSPIRCTKKVRFEWTVSSRTFWPDKGNHKGNRKNGIWKTELFRHKSATKAKKNPGIWNKYLDFFWCARRDLNPHVRSEH